MLSVIITAIIFAVGLVIILKFDESSFIGMLATVSGGFLLFLMIVIILLEHVGVSAEIEKYNIEYRSLCERYEIVTSDYEDVSKSDVIKDIAEWNINVYSYKYWTYNPWTNWFHSKRLADSLKMIETKKGVTK